MKKLVETLTTAEIDSAIADVQALQDVIISMKDSLIGKMGTPTAAEK